MASDSSNRCLIVQPENTKIICNTGYTGELLYVAALQVKHAADVRK